MDTLFPAIEFRDEFSVVQKPRYDLHGNTNEHHNTGWRIGLLHRGTNDTDDQWEVYMFIRRADTLVDWRIEAKLTITLLHPTYTAKHLTLKKVHVFTPADEPHCSLGRFKTRHGEFEANETMRFESSVQVLAISGVRQKRRLDFDTADATADGVVTVGERRFQVSRTVLGSHSPVFYESFFGQDGQSNNVEISIDPSTDPETFRHLLQILYNEPDVTKNNVLLLARLADQLDVTYVKRYLEKILCECPIKHITARQKLMLADKFKMDDLMRSALASISKPKDITGVRLQQMSRRSLASILERLITSDKAMAEDRDRDNAHNNQHRRRARPPRDPLHPLHMIPVVRGNNQQQQQRIDELRKTYQRVVTFLKQGSSF